MHKTGKVLCQTSMDGHVECSSVIINPMGPLNPETNEAICSTMRFVKEQASKMGVCCAALTFDQPLEGQ